MVERRWLLSALREYGASSRNTNGKTTAQLQEALIDILKGRGMNMLHISCYLRDMNMLQAVVKDSPSLINTVTTEVNAEQLLFSTQMCNLALFS